MVTYAYIDKETNIVKFTIETPLEYDINSNINDTLYCKISPSFLDLVHYTYEYKNDEFVCIGGGVNYGL